jgi:predicted permease
METLAKELRHAARRLFRSPAFSLAAILTLALAIGANAAIFSIVERVVLRPLPYPDSDRVIKVEHLVPRVNMPSFSAMPQGLYFLYLDRARSITAIAAYQPGEVTFIAEKDPERISVIRTTPSLMSVLRVAPQQGRWFAGEEGMPGGPRAAVLSHGFWMRRYGGDPAVIGRSAAIDGVPTVIAGVMPATFAFPDGRVDAYLAEQLDRAAGFGLFTHGAVARLREGATIADLRNEMNGLIGDLPQVYPGSALALSLALSAKKAEMRSTALTLKDATIGGITNALWIILASVGLVLLVACANVANLFLVRSEARQREVAVRRALGAGRRGIARYFFSESAILSLVGGACGLGLAWGAVQLLVAFGPATLPRLHEVRLDAMAALFTFGASVLAAAAFGAIPLMHGTPLAATLHENGRANTGSRVRHRARHLLMGGQVALALVLLVASGLMVRSFQKLRTIDPGFDATSALTFRLGLPEREYTDRRQAVAAHQTMLNRLSELPGVTVASASTCLPLESRCFGNSIFVDRATDLDRQRPRPVVTFQAIAPGYFEAMGQRLLRGRNLDRAEIERGEPNVVANQAFVDAYFPDQDPLGRRVASSRPPNLPPPAWLTIVGIVANTPTAALAEPAPAPKLYMPMTIAGGPDIPMAMLVGPSVAPMSYVVRTATPPLDLVPSVRRVVDAFDAKLALADVRTLQGVLDRASAQMAFTMALIAIAAAVALLLGVVGIYGVMSYIVSQRTGEIGVRLALGAEPWSVAGMIVRQGAVVALAGVVVGLAAAFAGSRLIESLLYGVGARDPGVFAITTVILILVALLACWLPARRASRLSPIEALRTD